MSLKLPVLLLLQPILATHTFHLSLSLFLSLSLSASLSLLLQDEPEAAAEGDDIDIALPRLNRSAIIMFGVATRSTAVDNRWS